jgi:hypothetical protein
MTCITETNLTLLDKNIISSIGHKLTSGIYLFPSQRRKKKVWISGIKLVDCVPEVMDFKELVLWCVDKFDTERRIMMQEHRWKSCRARPISVWEFVRELNAGSCSRYFWIPP